jgi:hypothetical protein
VHDVRPVRAAVPRAAGVPSRPVTRSGQRRALAG